MYLIYSKINVVVSRLFYMKGFTIYWFRRLILYNKIFSHLCENCHEIAYNLPFIII